MIAHLFLHGSSSGVALTTFMLRHRTASNLRMRGELQVFNGVESQVGDVKVRHGQREASTPHSVLQLREQPSTAGG